MTTALRKIWQITIGLMAMLSLSVVSVAACACSHHQAESEPKASCHSSSGHHEQMKTAPASHRFSQSCECIQTGTKVSVKAEGFKLKKHTSSSSAAAELESARFYSAAPATATLIKPDFYVVPFCYSTAARGPPLS